MITFKDHLLIEQITFEDYNKVLNGLFETDVLSEGLKDLVTKFGSKALSSLKRIFGPLKKDLLDIASELKIGLDQIISAFKERSVFQLLKALKFNLGKLFKATQAFTTAVRGGLLRTFEEIFKSGVFNKLRNGSLKVDEFLDKYPLLKKATGLVVAGLLVYIWLNMTFIGDFDFDFDFGDILGALGGSFSLTDLFVSPSGLMLFTLLATGGLISAPWLGATSLNLLTGILYTGYARLKGKGDRKILQSIKKRIKRQ